MQLQENVLPLSRYKPTKSAPLFIFVDLQKEFTLEGRPLQIASLGTALENCGKLLSLARRRRFPIAHVRLKQSSAAFNDLARGSEWIDEFKPFGSEMVFEREAPSCYACGEFASMMSKGGGTAAVLAGLAGSTSCLATLVRSHEEGHNVKFAFDASSSHALASEAGQSIHKSAVRIAAQFVELVRTRDILAGYSERYEARPQGI